MRYFFFFFLFFPVSPQGYERVRRVSEDDGSIAPACEDDEEEGGVDELTSRRRPPKQVRKQHLLFTCDLVGFFCFVC